MLPRCADVRDIQHRLEWQLILYAEVVGKGRRNLAIVIDGDQARRREQHLARAHLIHPPEEERLLDGRWWVLNEIEDRVALRTVVEGADPATHNKSLIADNVISEAETWREVNTAIAVEALFYPIARLKHTVDQLARVRHDPPNVGRRDYFPSDWVLSNTLAARVPVGPVEPRRVRCTELVGEEVGGLRRLVELLLDPVKPHTIIERQAVGQLPVVLRVPFDVVVAVFADDVVGGLRECVIDADRRVSEAESRIERIRCVVNEIVDAVIIGETALWLEAVLPEKAELKVVRPHDLRKTRRPVACRVEVIEGGVVRPDIRAVGDSVAVEDELGRHVDLHGVWIEQWNAGQTETCTIEFGIVWQNVDEIMTLAECYFQNGRCVE